VPISVCADRFGILAGDAAFRIAPITRADALAQLEAINGAAILGPTRGAAADRESIASILIAIGSIGLENEVVEAVDVNPLILRDDGTAVAADAAAWLATGDNHPKQNT
jgi:acetyl-CoA synthetase (ADP-forming)